MSTHAFRLTAAQAAEVRYVLEVHNYIDGARVVGCDLIVPVAELNQVAEACGSTREIHRDNRGEVQGAATKERMMARVCALLRAAGGIDRNSDDPAFR